MYPYRYAVCFDSETVFVRDPFDLPESIRLLDERKIYYSTYHNDTMDHVTYPAYALLRWHPSWRNALVHETRGFHLHGWWSDLPYYDMAKVTDFFLAFVGENLFQYDHHLTTAVIQTSRELGRWAFEHNVYKYYMIANYGWKMADLNQHPDTKHFMPGERSPATRNGHSPRQRARQWHSQWHSPAAALALIITHTNSSTEPTLARTFFLGGWDPSASPSPSHFVLARICKRTCTLTCTLTLALKPCARPRRRRRRP